VSTRDAMSFLCSLFCQAWVSCYLFCMKVDSLPTCAIICPPGVIPVDILGKALPKSRSRRLPAALREAAAQNLGLRGFTEVVGRHGVDTVTLARGRDTLDPEFLAMHHHGQTVFFSEALEEMLTLKRYEPLAPGMNMASRLGLAAVLRHEYAHGLWEKLQWEDTLRFIKEVPTDYKEIAVGLTGYAADHFGQWWSPPEQTGGYVQAWPAVETWTELFALSTDEAFHEKGWPRWVRSALETQRKILGPTSS
jgi:hypothetical protein